MWGRGGAEKDKQEILSLFVLSPVVVVSFLLRQRVVARQAVGSCLAWVRVEAFGSFFASAEELFSRASGPAWLGRAFWRAALFLEES